MPTLRDIRQRIRGIESTKKITKSMKTMALVRLQKQETRTRNSRHFSDTVTELLSYLGEALPEEILGSEPYFTHKPDAPELWVVFTSDRGLCGAYNSNLLRFVDQELAVVQKEGRSVEIIWIGLKGLQHAQRRGHNIKSEHTHLPAEPTHQISEEISKECQKAFLEGGFGSVHLIYNFFRSVLKREFRKTRFLPVEYSSFRKGVGESFPLYLVEPNIQSMLKQLIPLYLRTRMYQTLLESSASEHAARMMTMEQATNNAESLLKDLTHAYHKARQSSITRELVEVVNAAEALS